MVHLLLIHVTIPANASVFFKNLLSFVTFDLLPIKSKENELFGFEKIPFAEQF